MAVVSSRSNSPRSSSFFHRQQSWMAPWLLFVVGCCLGHLHGRYSAVMDDRTPFHHRHHHQPDPRPQQCNCVEDGNGWRSIQVFYGKTDHLDASSASWPLVPLNSTAAAAVEDRTRQLSSPGTPPLSSSSQQQQQQPHRWYGQARQDELVFALLGNKTGGFFVDLAANDATELSNTYALETFHQWRGVCIEPNDMYWSNLTYRLGCTVIGAVVGKERMQEVYFRFEAGDHGGIADAGFDNGKRWQRTSQKRYTVTLLEILRERIPHGGAPTDIDYLSLDVEGAETFILRNFPLNEYRIKIITAERLRGEIREYLKSHGYEFVERLTRWGESLWVHESAKDQVDWSVLERFGFPLG